MKPALKSKYEDMLYNEKGAIGYILAWLAGVPLTLLLVIWVIRGFD
ncbi:MAG TPA: hypothetical protein VM598_11525 [Bdellovibrionota bacterium]|jgi:hypothetical protein|nr:hypothetical protein [Bdellovibrionota bacterium]